VGHRGPGRYAGRNRAETARRKLHGDVTAVQNSEAVQKHFASEGAQIVQMSTPEFSAFIEKEMKKWERVVKEGNIKAE
jgi:tripartite-type tricarboxylate transporter receptor subunit TctC